MILLENKNIVLRKAKLKDLDSMYQNIWSDDDISKTMFWEPTKTYAAAKERLERSIEFQKNAYAYFVALKCNDEAIGFCGIKEVEPEIFIETGICIGSKYQNKGYGKEVLELLIDLVFNKLKGNKFIYACMRDNLKSKSLCLHYGFKYLKSTNETRQWDQKSFLVDYYELNNM